MKQKEIIYKEEVQNLIKMLNKRLELGTISQREKDNIIKLKERVEIIKHYTFEEISKLSNIILTDSFKFSKNFFKEVLTKAFQSDTKKRLSVIGRSNGKKNNKALNYKTPEILYPIEYNSTDYHLSGIYNACNLNEIELNSHIYLKGGIDPQIWSTTIDPMRGKHFALIFNTRETIPAEVLTNLKSHLAKNLPEIKNAYHKSLIALRDENEDWISYDGNNPVPLCDVDSCNNESHWFLPESVVINATQTFNYDLSTEHVFMYLSLEYRKKLTLDLLNEEIKEETKTKFIALLKEIDKQLTPYL